MKERPTGYLPTLDGWRAIAILAVCVAHGANAIVGPGAPHDSTLWLTITLYGVRGVDLFFGISGFLICSRLLEEHEARGSISLKGFYIRRFARILPPYLLLLAALALLGALGIIAITGGQLAASLVFLRNYFTISDDLGWYTGHLWSLAVEEHFYLLWPALLVFWGPARARPRVVLFALVIAAWRVIEFRHRFIEQALPGAGFYMRTDTRLDALLWGCWAALLLREPVWRDRLTKWLRPHLWMLLVVVLVANLVFTPPLAMLWQAALIPFLLAGTVLHPESPASRLLETAPLRWIGRISYSLYLWQQLFLVPLARRAELGALHELPFNICAAFACAALSYYVIERPAIRLGHRLAPPTTEGRA